MGPSDDDEPRDEAAEGEHEADERAAILKRRARFVASALAGLSLAGCSDPSPGPCLKMAPTAGEAPTASSSGSATATSSATTEPPDAGVDSGDAGAGSASAQQTPPSPCLEIAPPRPCLKIAPPPKPPPRPCLNVAKPDD